MKRFLLSALLLLAIGLQGSISAFAAASNAMQADCGTPPTSQSATANDVASAGDSAPMKESCCHHTSHATSCCQGACSTAAMALLSSSAPRVLFGRTADRLQLHAVAVATRSDSPLIRPPIL